MCDPVTLFGVGTVSALGPTIPMVGLIGAGGSFGLGAGSLIGAGSFGTAFTGASAISGSSIFGLASSAFSMFSGSGQSAFQQAQFEYMAGQARYNAQVAENNALQARYAAEHDADLIDDKKKRIAAKGVTKFAKSGVVINQDTPLLIDEEIASSAMEDRLNRLYQGDMEGRAFKATAANHIAQANNYRISGQNAVTTSRLKSINTALKFGESLLAK
tara:strand:- start:1304 stop:1951 length:648 start_codon:yes stop_codon:yes gene_type:complete